MFHVEHYNKGGDIVTKIWVDPISGRKCAIGLSSEGYKYEVVQYGELVQMSLMFSTGNWCKPFMERATVEEMVTRMGAK
jgi:hypothetical protein